MDILSEKWTINRYLEFVNESNNVYKIKADAGIKIRSAWHTYYNIKFFKDISQAIWKKALHITVMVRKGRIWTSFCR